ncbi:MAG: glutathione S-transferase N-terminal domain-containing protein [Rhodospirillaceae bacterium]
MPTFTLVSSETSPFGRKVRIALDVLGLGSQFTLQHATTMDPDDPIRRINPLGKIPALIVEDGSAVFDSRVIVDYLDARFGDGQLIPRDINDRVRVLTLAAMAEGVLDALLLIMYEGRFREPDQASKAWLDHQYGKVRRGLEAAVARLDEFAAPNIAAITLACALGYADWRKQIDWRAEFAALEPWLDDFARAVPAWKATQA